MVEAIGTNEIMRRTGKSKTCVWRWQERFKEDGVDGLLHDKTRPSRIPRLGPEVAEHVVALTLADLMARAKRHQRQCRPSHLEDVWAAAASSPAVQALQ